MNKNGEAVPARILGLLLSNGGTVCDDGFSDNSAEAICRQMGFMGKLSWTYGAKWDIQASKEITLDDVACTTDEWSSCTYSLEPNCGHGEDIFLQCDGVGELVYSITSLSCRILHNPYISSSSYLIVTKCSFTFFSGTFFSPYLAVLNKETTKLTNFF